MGLRPGRAYNKPVGQAYTRISKRKPRKSYVKGVPRSKIFHFEIGDVARKNNNEFPLIFHLVPSKYVQIRSNCLESARLAILGYYKKITDTSYFAKIRTYPHIVLRENPLATGAGADRFSQGMRKAFGKPIGMAARVKKGQKFITVWGPEGSEAKIKEALRRAARKLPGTCRVVQD